MFSPETDILRKLRLIEWLKAELITHVAQLFQAMANNSEQAMRQGFAALIIAAYVLGKRVGLDFTVMDEQIAAQLDRHIQQAPEVETEYGDLSGLQRHLRQRRG